jgi:hypothetical protein
VGWAFYISKREREREKKQRSPQEITWLEFTPNKWGSGLIEVRASKINSSTTTINCHWILDSLLARRISERGGDPSFDLFYLLSFFFFFRVVLVWV